MTAVILRGLVGQYPNNIQKVGDLYVATFNGDTIACSTHIEMLDIMRELHNAQGLIQNGETWTFIQYSHVNQLELLVESRKGSQQNFLFGSDIEDILDYLQTQVHGKWKFFRFPAQSNGMIAFEYQKEAMLFKLVNKL